MDVRTIFILMMENRSFDHLLGYLSLAGHPVEGLRNDSRWRDDVANLLSVANRAGEEPVEQVHVGTEQGEVFAIRSAGLTAVAVTERFALASVLFFDLRSILRDLATGGDGRAGGAGGAG